MKSRIAPLLLALLLTPGAARADAPASIGISTALTGNASAWGGDIRKTMVFADEVLAGNKYKLIFEDDACSGKAAVTAAHKLLEVDHVAAVAGFACSSTVLAGAPLFNAARVVAISPSASAAAISSAGDYIFRTWPSDEHAASMLFDYIAAHHKRLGVLTEETDYAQGFLKGIQAGTARAAVKVHNENFLSDAPDYRSLITRVSAQGIDALFLNTQTETTFFAVLQQVRASNVSAQLYAAYWPSSADFRVKAGPLAEGIIYVDGPSADEVFTPEGKQLLERYKARYGQPAFSDMLFGTAFEAFRAVHLALSSGGDPKEYLYRTTFHGVFGDWSFDSNGDIRGLSFAIRQIRSGVPVTLTPATR